jgi:hypothetical protein
MTPEEGEARDEEIESWEQRCEGLLSEISDLRAENERLRGELADIRLRTAVLDEYAMPEVFLR